MNNYKDICQLDRQMPIQQLNKLNEKGTKRENFFPLSVVQAIFDKRGIRLDSIISSFNYIFLPYAGTKEATRLQVVELMRRKSLVICYRDLNDNVTIEMYNSNERGDNEWKKDDNWLNFEDYIKQLIIEIGVGGSIYIDDELSLESENAVQNKVITEALNRINKELFPLTISVSGGGLFEKRTTQTITVSWVVKEGSDKVTPTSITVNDEAVTNTDTSKQFINVTTNTIYTVKAIKDDVAVTGSTSVTFVNPSYFGAVSYNFTPTEEAIKALIKSVKNGRGYTGTTSLNNQKTCYAYPKSFGALTAIKDANNFEYLQSYIRTELTIWDETYYVYVLTDPVTIDSFKQIYS